MTMDYRELNNIVLPTHMTVPNIVIMLDILGRVLGMSHTVLDLANFFFSISMATESQD